jgi:hypothetical protein
MYICFTVAFGSLSKCHLGARELGSHPESKNELN